MPDAFFIYAAGFISGFGTAAILGMALVWGCGVGRPFND